jgi:SAM-dependent methyltransferase
MPDLLCPLCSGEKFEKIYNRVRHTKNSSIEKCVTCGLIFQYPYMPPAEEKEFYEKQFPEYMKKRGAASETEPAAHFETHKKEALRRLEYIRPYLNESASALELGSSTGFFIDEIRPFVKDVCGVEPGELYADFANSRGIKTYGALDEIKAAKFDIIFSFYVFEHLRNPIEFLNKLKENITDNGKVIFEVPGVDDILVSFYKTPEILDFHWQLAHYFYYSAETLKKTFEKCGYKVLEVKYNQRYDISNHIHWLKEKKPGGLGRYTDIFGDKLNKVYKDNLISLGLSDTVTIFAQI